MDNSGNVRRMLPGQLKRINEISISQTPSDLSFNFAEYLVNGGYKIEYEEFWEKLEKDFKKEVGSFKLQHLHFLGKVELENTHCNFRQFTYNDLCPQLPPEMSDFLKRQEKDGRKLIDWLRDFKGKKMLKFRSPEEVTIEEIWEDLGKDEVTEISDVFAYAEALSRFLRKGGKRYAKYQEHIFLFKEKISYTVCGLSFIEYNEHYYRLQIYRFKEKIPEKCLIYYSKQF